MAVLDGAGDDLRDGFASLELHRQRPPIDLELGVKLSQRIAQRPCRRCAGERRNEATELEQALVLAQTVGLVFDPPALFEVAILRVDGRDEALDDRQCRGGRLEIALGASVGSCPFAPGKQNRAILRIGGGRRRQNVGAHLGGGLADGLRRFANAPRM